MSPRPFAGPASNTGYDPKPGIGVVTRFAFYQSKHDRQAAVARGERPIIGVNIHRCAGPGTKGRRLNL